MQSKDVKKRPRFMRRTACVLAVAIGIAPFSAGCGGGNVKTDGKTGKPAATKGTEKSAQDGSSSGGDGSGSK